MTSAEAVEVVKSNWPPEHYTMLTEALAVLIAHDDAIRREFWDELQREAEIHCDRRVELLGPIETTDDAAFRKALLDGWSAWLLAKKIIDSRRAAILGSEPSRDLLPETKSTGGANTLPELISLLKIARDNKTGISLDWVETGIALRNLAEPAREEL